MSYDATIPLLKLVVGTFDVNDIWKVEMKRQHPA